MNGNPGRKILLYALENGHSNVKYKQFVVNGLKHANVPVRPFNLRK